MELKEIKIDKLKCETFNDQGKKESHEISQNEIEKYTKTEESKTVGNHDEKVTKTTQAFIHNIQTKTSTEETNKNGEISNEAMTIKPIICIPQDSKIKSEEKLPVPTTKNNLTKENLIIQRNSSDLDIQKQPSKSDGGCRISSEEEVFTEKYNNIKNTQVLNNNDIIRSMTNMSEVAKLEN